MIEFLYIENKKVDKYTVNRNVVKCKTNNNNDLPFYLPMSNQTVEEAIQIYARSSSNAYNLERFNKGVSIQSS